MRTIPWWRRARASPTGREAGGDAPPTESPSPGSPGRGVGAAPGGRLTELDGLRGLAVLLVVVYHLFARWAEPLHETTLYPHGNALTHLPALAYLGAYGVLLFFLTSGFVIVMTLERSSGVADFALRRTARLWPTMLVCATLSTLVINLSGIAFYPTAGLERWHVTTLEYVFSIFFVPPDLVADALGLERAQWVEGVYWTLWAEVRFYVLVALVFALRPGAAFLSAWAAVQALSTGLELARAVFDVRGSHLLPVLVLQPGYLAWFSLGICGYYYWTGRMRGLVWAIVALALTAIVAVEVVTPHGFVPAFAPGAWPAMLVYGAVMATFALFLCRHRAIRLVTWRPVVVIGLASYPLYLFHERAAMTALPYLAGLGVAPAMGAALVFAGLIAVAVAIHHLAEQPARRALTRWGRPWVRRAEAARPWLRFG